MTPVPQGNITSTQTWKGDSNVQEEETVSSSEDSASVEAGTTEEELIPDTVEGSND